MTNPIQIRFWSSSFIKTSFWIECSIGINSSLSVRYKQTRIWVSGSHKIQIYDASSEDLQTTTKLGEINLANVLNESTITGLEFLSNTELLVSTSQKIYKVDFNENDNYAVGVLELSLDTRIEYRTVYY